jgi:hypothetical protein
LPYRSRPIDWNLLLQPSIEASRINERNDERKRQQKGGLIKLARGVAGAAIGGPVGGFVGGGFAGLTGALGRQESARQFDASLGMRQQTETRMQKAQDAKLYDDADFASSANNLIDGVLGSAKQGGINPQAVAGMQKFAQNPANQRTMEIVKNRVTGQRAPLQDDGPPPSATSIGGYGGGAACGGKNQPP